MNKTVARLGLALAGLLVVLLAWGQTGPPSVTVQKVTVLPSRVNTRVVLETSAPLQVAQAAYAKDAPATLDVELAGVGAFAAPAVPVDEPQLLREIRVRPGASGRTVLSLVLAEPVPFAVARGANETSIELVKIQKPGADYIVSPEVQRELRAGERKAVALPTVDVTDKGDRIEATARLGRKGVANVFALAQPLRLVVDIFDAQYGEGTKSVPFGAAGIEAVKVGQFRAGQTEAITRLVFELKTPRGYALNNGAAGLTVAVYKDAAPAAPAAEPARPSSPPVVEEKAAAAEVRGVPAQERKETPGNSPKDAAAVPVATLPKVEPQAAAPPPQKTEAKPPAEQFKPKTIDTQEERYSGELISPKFKDADLRDVVLWLGERVGLNVLFDPEVRGSVTCSFEDVPWDQFLDLILRNNHLGKTLDGNVLRIAPTTVLTREADELAKLREVKETSGPLLTRTYSLSYAKAAEVVDLLKGKVSDRGEMVIDIRTNTILLTETKERIDLIEKLIAVLDTQTPQVTIEARIVEATSTFIQNLGIQWGARGVVDPFYGNQTSLQFPNKILLDGAVIPQGITTKGLGGPLGGYAVNLPAPAFSTAVGFSFANILDTFRLDLALTALETSGSGRIISSPKVTAQNNKEAYVIQGRQIPVQTQANFTVSVQYVNAALELRATPQITAEGTIIMVLDIQNNAADFANLVNGIPPITTQSAKTTVMVPDGGTTVIGGIYRVEDSITRERVPFLHQIPILGALFRNLAHTKQNRELLIFITPRIIK